MENKILINTFIFCDFLKIYFCLSYFMFSTSIMLNIYYLLRNTKKEKLKKKKKSFNQNKKSQNCFSIQFIFRKKKSIIIKENYSKNGKRK